jgi:hypothetical protein
MTSDVLQLVDLGTGLVVLTAWLRTLICTGHVLYAGTYEPCQLPGRDGQCLRVVFPLPNGNAMVIMRPVVQADGSLTLVSAGDGFGGPGFYFTIRKTDDTVWVRYVRSLCESIHVYPSTDVGVRADHNLTLFGIAFLRLHYRLRPALANAEMKTAT